MFKKSALAVITVIGMLSLSVPVMAATNTHECLTAISLSKEDLKAADKTMFVTADLLYVRDLPSMEGEIIGGLNYGESVLVTGQKEKAGEDPGWFRVSLDGINEGFVSAEFLSDTEPEPIAPPVYTAAPAAPAKTAYRAPAAAAHATPAKAPATGANAYPVGGRIVKTSYVYMQDGTVVKIQKDSNGKWKTASGTGLTWVTDYDAVTDSGVALSSYNPTKSTAPAAVPAKAPAASANTYPVGGRIIKTSYVYAEDGTVVKIQKDSNGKWKSANGTGLTWVTDYDAVTDSGEALSSYKPTKAVEPAEPAIHQETAAETVTETVTETASETVTETASDTVAEMA